MVAITITQSTVTTGGIPGLVSTVAVTYDERDIPTINCTQSVDCYAVLGFIHARDRLFEMDFFRRAGRGRLAELVGDAALDQDEAIRTFFTTRDGHSMPEALTDHVHEDADVSARLAAYANGINAFIGQLRGDASKLPAAYKQLQYVINPASADELPDWTDVDTVAVARLFQFQLSETAEQEGDYGKWAATWSALIQGGVANDPGQLSIGLWMQAKSPIEAFTLSGSGAANALNLVAAPSTLESLRAAGPALGAASRKLDALRQVRALMGSPPGSNNWVVDGAHTDIGQAFVANDPHLPLNYPSNFHLSHLIGSEDQLNVQGAIFPGVPATLIRTWHPRGLGRDRGGLRRDRPLRGDADRGARRKSGGQLQRAAGEDHRRAADLPLPYLRRARDAHRPAGREGLSTARADHRRWAHTDHGDQRAVDRPGDADRRSARLPPSEQRSQRRGRPPGARG